MQDEDSIYTQGETAKWKLGDNRQPSLCKRTVSLSGGSFLKLIESQATWIIFKMTTFRCISINKSRWLLSSTEEITVTPAAQWNFLSPPSLPLLFLPQTSKSYLHSYKICLQSTSLQYWSFLSPSPPPQVTKQSWPGVSKPQSQLLLTKRTGNSKENMQHLTHLE